MSQYHLHNDEDTHSHDDEHCSNHSLHNHSHDFHGARNQRKSTLKFILFMTFSFSIIEMIGGYFSHSLALVSDAIHMITDSSSLLLAFFMAHISNKPADHNHSYGHGRADILGAFVNSLFMLGVVGFIFYEAIIRIIHPENVESLSMFFIATIGLMINLISLFLLHKNHQNLNIKAAIVHIVGDLLGSVAAIIASLIIYFTHWNIIDPILSIVVCLVLIGPTIHIIKKSVHVLMEGVPEHLSYQEIGKTLSDVEYVVDIHDLHIWTMSSEHIALSAHIEIEHIQYWESTLNVIQKLLAEKYQITHVTLQVETENIEKHPLLQH